MSNKINHPYHIVDESPWPMYGSLSGMYLTTGFMSWFHNADLTMLLVGGISLMMIMYQWWRDISREGTMLGLHTSIVELGLRSGMILFIVSEVFFFVSFFWAYFHGSLSPALEVGGVWPYPGIQTFSPMGVPLLNTLVLISSGISVTWSHHALMKGELNEAFYGLLITCGLGVYFTFLQGLEYYEAPFSFSDGMYGSTFFIATGFHGIHVIIGTIFLMVCLKRMSNLEFSKSHHFGFEAACWYWHFVDVVWLFLYLAIYVWGSI